MSNCELGLGFQSGPDGFVNYCKTVSKVDIAQDAAQDIVYKWRAAPPNLPIVAFWKQCDHALKCMYDKQAGYMGGPDGKLLYFDGTRTIMGQRVPGIRLPDGIWLNYYQMQTQPGKYGPEFTYAQRKGRNLIRTKIYSGRLTENIVQAVGAAAVKFQINHLARHVPVTMTTHDEAVFVVSETSKDWGIQLAEWAFALQPPWLAGCPFAGEAGAAQRYGDC